MNQIKPIHQTVELIIEELVNEDLELSAQEKLAIIGAESIKAIAFMGALEEEWEIEIPDEKINGNFFTSIDYIVECIENSLNQ